MGLARGISFRSNGTMAHDVFISYAEVDCKCRLHCFRIRRHFMLGCATRHSTWREMGAGNHGCYQRQWSDGASVFRRREPLVSCSTRSGKRFREWDHGHPVPPKEYKTNRHFGVLPPAVQWLDAFTQPLESHFKSLAALVGDLLSKEAGASNASLRQNTESASVPSKHSVALRSSSMAAGCVC
jgi:hypothetical protein